MAPSIELEEAVRTLKLRGNASGISVHLTKADLKNMLLLPRPCGPSSIAASDTSKRAIEDGKEESQESQSSAASVVSEEPPVALQPVAAKLAASAREPCSRKKSVAETLAELKSAVKAVKAEEPAAPAREEHEENQRKKPTKGVKRSRDDEKIVKSDSKPKAKKHVKQADETKKAKQKKSQKKKAVCEKKEVKMTRKCFTSRAYHRVLSKESKVMSVERAKVFAREAHQKAGEEWDEKHKL